jgi:hypothetical protein
MIGDPAEKGELRNSISAHCRHGNENGEIANSHASKDSRPHPVHAIFRAEWKFTLKFNTPFLFVQVCFGGFQRNPEISGSHGSSEITFAR